MTDNRSHDRAAARPVGPILELVDYRRRVAEIYGEVRRRGVDHRSWAWWVDARNELLLTHPQSPLAPDRRASGAPIDYFDYDPSWRMVGTIEPAGPGAGGPSVTEEGSTFTTIGSVGFERAGIEHRLDLLWLEGYGGGLFLPFRDATNGTATYGAGRYLLDGAKSADLGSPGPDQLLLDFNFSYHPSCAWDDRWSCPLAPPTNRLGVGIEAGERLPATANT